MVRIRTIENALRILDPETKASTDSTTTGAEITATTTFQPPGDDTVAIPSTAKLASNAAGISQLRAYFGWDVRSRWSSRGCQCPKGREGALVVRLAPLRVLAPRIGRLGRAGLAK